MTRPGGPAEPPSPGERVVQEWARANDIGAWRDYEDLARRIDAALAQWEAHACVQHDGIIQALQAALAERETQLAALHEALQPFYDRMMEVYEAAPDGILMVNEDAAVVSWAKDTLTSTADAAARCLTRARQEGAEAMRERLLRFTMHHPRCGAGGQVGWREKDRGVCNCGLASALDAGAPAARRG